MMWIMNNQMLLFLFLIVAIWLWGYIFGFLAGMPYGENNVLERFIEKKYNISISTESEGQGSEDNG